MEKQSIVKQNGIDFYRIDGSSSGTPKPIKKGIKNDDLKAEVEQIWRDYDISMTGRLSKDEAFNFLRDALEGVDGR